MKKIHLLSLVVLLFMGSCAKYEEGPALSLRSKTARLCGSWKLSEIYINDVLQESPSPSTMEINKNGSCSRTSTDTWTQTEMTCYGTWTFNTDKTAVDFQWELSNPGITLTESWTILRLKEKELWIETLSYGSISQCRFVQ